MRNILAVFISLFVVSAAIAAPRTPPWELGRSRGEDLAVSIYVFGPGANLEEWWGHIGLRIADTRQGGEVLYNWGMFSFDSDLVKGFATGRLRFWVEAEPLPPVLAMYRRFGRSIRYWKLNLTPPQRLELAKLITGNVKPENREYDYEYFRDNCATRIRDLIDKVTEGAVARATRQVPARLSTREHVDLLTSHNLPMSLIIGFLLNWSIDKPAALWDEMFLPDEVIPALKRVLVEDAEGKSVPLVDREVVVSSGRPEYQHVAPLRFYPYELLLSCLMGLLPLLFLVVPGIRCPVVRRSGIALSAVAGGLALGIPGTVLLVFNVASNHTYTYWNANLLLANPLTLSLAVAGPLVLWRGPRKAIWAMRIAVCAAVLALGALVVEVIPGWNIQTNGTYLRLCLPWVVGLAAALVWNRRLKRDAGNSRSEKLETPEVA